jgi:rhamnosyltransferase
MASAAATTPPGRLESKAEICAVVVTCNPDAGFPERLSRVRPQVACVVVVDNGSPPTAVEMLRNAAANPDFDLILNDSNLGVATALNQGARFARARSFRWVLTLDQDSTVEPFLVDALLHAYAMYPSIEKVAVVGSNYYDEKRGKTLAPASPADPPYLEQTTVITSGTLLSLAAFEKIGPFRDDFFIDHVDDEYCLRARSMGYRVILCRKPVIRHSIGGAIGKGILGRMVWSSNHSPARRYYMARNFLWTTRKNLFSSPRWVASRAIRHAGFLLLMLLLEKDRWEKIEGAARGVRDGLRGTPRRVLPG